MVLRIVKWIVAALVAVAVFIVAAVAIARWQSPTAKQAEALRLLEPVSPAGRNGFAQGWLLSSDVPMADVDAVMAKEMADFAAASREAKTVEELAELSMWGGSAKERYGDSGFDGDGKSAAPLRCNRKACLASVRAALPAYEARAATPQWQNLYARYDAMLEADHVSNLFVPAQQPPMPEYQTFLIGETRNAYWFARGEQVRALAGACRGVAVWTRFNQQADSLIAAMIYTAAARQGITQTAQFLSELPADLPLPAECRDAFPVASIETSVNACPMMRGEFTYMSSAIQPYVDGERDQQPAWRRPLFWLLADRDIAKAQFAEPVAQACTAAARDAIRGDRPVRYDRAVVTTDYLAPRCFSSMLTCIQTSIGIPSLEQYVHRGQDFGAERQLGATLVWLRDHPDSRPLAARLADRPAVLKTAGHPVTVGADGTSLQIPLFKGDNSTSTFSLPIYASRLGAAGGSPAGNP